MMWGIFKMTFHVCLPAACRRAGPGGLLARARPAEAMCRTAWTGSRISCRHQKRACRCDRLSQGNGGTVPVGHRPLLSMASSPEERQKRGVEDSQQFTLIYRFPGIQFCRGFSRLKLLQTSITVLLLPPVYYFYWTGQASLESLLYSTGIALFAGGMLYSISFYLRRIIGMIYLNEVGSTIKVSHLTFWGRRKDIFIPIENVMTLAETGDHKGEILLQLKRYDNPMVLYFTIKFGKVVDKEKFLHVFGRVR
ncbi:transmembrane protein 186 [Rhinatrema bivittatum]|uniref:transmembrane protein 186 n=1 Tax=Rhinatrema bivittatum TaxID=194408 RepID=UPI0011294780|nr:transmembrane protein 186 [Rhinatrema bivittatum]XP_029431980.1 transmembrane protein 186 [Rhinatrema bivittatum]XP_029431981.1 transmembrane protein 186 [Rhinatrema bivittatum]